MDIEREIKSLAPVFTKEIKSAASWSHNEAEFRTRITRLIENFVKKIDLDIELREEYSLFTGRADAVYRRLIIEYEPPGSLRPTNNYRTNQHAIKQTEDYIVGLIQKGRHKPERIAGVILDGSFFIFIRSKAGVWYRDEPLKVSDYATEHFLKLLASLSTEQALIPENLIEDFGENTEVAQKVVGGLYNALTTTNNTKSKKLFEQWSLQFGEVSDYEEASKLKVESFGKKFGIDSKKIPPFYFFFCLHTYYATLIKLLALQAVQYYAMPKFGTDLKQAATFSSDEIRRYLLKMEAGGIFKELGISNFIEGDFFGWYLDVWNDEIYQAFKMLISTLANYSLVTLDVDPDTTRDLLKKLYQQLMPKELRHNLGEYYTPDWLAERLLFMLVGKEIKLDKRILDPACGSGTFLVIAIKKMREYAWANALPETQVLEKILSNVVGFDLNPLAVISARTNYLLALGDLIQHRKGEINIPIYLCDSIMTPSEGEDLFGKGIMKFNTAVGQFAIPKNLVEAKYIDILSNFLEEAVSLKLNQEQFIERLCQKLPLNQSQDFKDIESIYILYNKLLDLDKQKINGIWARIIKNAFAPLFVGEFDYVAGNPPWVNWENLPENYRKELIPIWTTHYDLFPHKGFDSILGKSKDDISVLMTYVAIDKYLKKSGKLGFVITQSVFKTGGGGKGFRKFTLPDKTPIQVLHVDDMVELNPFEGASNRTSVVIFQKGKPTKYPLLSYLYWRKTKHGGIPIESSLEDVIGMTERKQFVAEPIDKNDLTSSWITGRPKALIAVRKIFGKSDYVAHEGINSGGANAVYWVNVIEKRKDGYVVISNIIKGAKREVENVQKAIEPDLLYPLLRAGELKKWKAEPSASILVCHLPGMRLNAISESDMKKQYPQTYLYLKKFEKELRERAAFKRYFTRKNQSNKIIETGPFYSVFNIGDYTFADYKVVWTRIANIEAAVIDKKNDKYVIPQETITLVPLKNKYEAYYLAAMVNAAPFQYVVSSYAQGKSMGSMHVLENICIKKFNSKNSLHLKLAMLSDKAHEFAKANNENKVKEIEEEIDDVAAKIWGLSLVELKEIKVSLEELIK